MPVSVERLPALCLIITGLSHVVQPRAWAAFFICLREQGAIGSLKAGLMHLPLGLIIVTFHNAWHGGGILVTIIGWALLVKSVTYMLVPAHGQRMLSRISEERAWEFVVAGVFGIALGAVVVFLSFR